jgi:4'-phosphopantetheinyl transferase
MTLARPAPSLVQLWSASTTDAERGWGEWPLSPSEQERAARFVFEKDRLTFVLGRRMLRSLLGDMLGCAPGAVPLALGAHGKPELEGGARSSGLCFNLAHSGAQVLCAVALGRGVGVDVERERGDLDVLELARRFFCAREIRRLEEAAPAEARRLFYRYWTLKEAYLKAEGTGLGLSLTAIDVSGVPEGFPTRPAPPIEDRPRGILVLPVPWGDGHQAAVAAGGPDWSLEVRPWRA